MKTVTTTLGELNVRIVGDENPNHLVVLCHGYGAPGTDLVGLANALVHLEPSLGQGVQFIFPEAPISLAAGFFESRAWWHIDMAKLEQAMATGELRDMRNESPEGLPDARRKILGLLDILTQTTGLSMGQITLGGFSQGAMLATDVALRLEEAPHSLCIMSGTLLTADIWEQKARARTGLNVFQSHGQVDPLLPFAGATWLKELLEEAGISVDFHPFNGAHTIPQDVLESLASFLQEKR